MFRSKGLIRYKMGLMGLIRPKGSKGRSLRYKGSNCRVLYVKKDINGIKRSEGHEGVKA